jgi:assimilatory nitrate reductase catalytic subunit
MKTIPLTALPPSTVTRATCPYCGTGCGVLIESRGSQIVQVQGDPDHPANFGRLCTKGSTLHLTAAEAINRQARLLHPMRRPRRHAPTERVSWDSALDEAADRLAAIVREHGPQAVGFYGSGQLLTEDYYVLNKLVKGLLGTNNLDTNSRLCMSSAVAGYKVTLGSDAPPACYEDFDHAGTLFITGANTAWAHPILFRRIEAARQARPDMKVIVVDPRRTETADMADLHLAIRPGTDVALCHGILHILARDKLLDQAFIRDHTSGFSELLDIVGAHSPERVSELCGIRREDLELAASWFGQHTPTLSLYCQGLNQSSQGTDKNAALINLHLATGQIGKPGAGPFSLTGQPNAMGGREVGGMANLLSAHRNLGSEIDRAEVAALWGVRDVPAQPGKTAVEMFEAAARGEIKALWIACTNPAQSLPDQHTVRKALERAELVVVQEAFATTATCDFADILLPASTWGEKDGTVTNSERRVSRVRPAVPAAGEARHDWAIFTALARRLEARLPERTARYLPGTDTLFPYTTPESVWNEHRETTRGRDLDITGLSYALLDEIGPQQWPMPEGERAGRARLYTDGRFATPDGRARFAAVRPLPAREVPDERFPFALNTGRLRDQWHGMSRTGTLGRLFGHAAEPCVELHPADMAELGLSDGQLVQLTSRRGQLVVPAVAHEGMGRQQAYIAMHWGAEALGGIDAHGRRVGGVNALTQPAFCPTSKQPELKHAAVRLNPVDLPWGLLAFAWLPAEQALALRALLKPWMARFPFTACVPFGREPDEQGRVGVLFRAASSTPIDGHVIDELAELFGVDGLDVMRYDDVRQGQHRRMRTAQADTGRRLVACLMVGDTASEKWVRPMLQDDLAVDALGSKLLAPGAAPPVDTGDRGKQVCTCFNVSDLSIVEVLGRCEGSPGQRLAALQGELRCGTNCGSCLPALRKLVQQTPAQRTEGAPAAA